MLCNGWTRTNIQKKRMASKGVCLCASLEATVHLKGSKKKFFLK